MSYADDVALIPSINKIKASITINKVIKNMNTKINLMGLSFNSDKLRQDHVGVDILARVILTLMLL